MRSCAISSRTSGRFPRVGFRRVAAMSLIALCKVALLLATVEASVQALESNAEVAQCAQIHLANPPEGLGVARRVLIKRLPARCLRAGLSAAVAHCYGPVAHAAAADGHRLANRLCAPMRC